jgi:ABC-type Mn2+/Zn2+ transport system ATPase subunit
MELKYWERAALDKISEETELSEETYEELLTYFLQDAGLLPAPATRPRLSFPDDLAVYTQMPPCRLERIFNLKNVNALPETQELRFGPQLTLIYGENGAGKTGYTRPLGCAAFARGEREVLPDATSPRSNRMPQADIEISYGGAKQIVRWTNGRRVQELAGFYVFDAYSLIAHLTGSNSLSFSPFGLSLLTKLAEVTDQVRAKVRHLIEEKEVTPTFVMLFQGTSGVSNILTNLGVHTDLDALEQLSKLTVDEEKEAERLDKEIAELKLTQIPKEIEKRRWEIRDIEGLIDSVKKAQRAVGEATLEDVNRLIRELQERQVESEHSGVTQFTSDSFTAVGSLEWREFLRAANRLAQMESQAGALYPRDGDKCLLCSQNLSGDAISLIQRLWKFLRSDPQALLEKAQDALAAKVTELTAVSFDYLGEDSNAGRLVQQELPEITGSIQAHREACYARRTEMLEALRLLKICNPAPMIKVDLTDLSRLVRIRVQDIQELQQSDLGQRLARAEGALLQLRHRKLLADHLAEARDYVGRTRWAARARQTLGSTKIITTKYNELFRELVTEQYTTSFETTLRRFKENMRITIETRGMKGETVRQIAFRSDEYPAGYSVSQILSDGEKRAAAITDFLTEVSFDRSSTGIILDDPVTSFDDRWKSTLAECLVEQAGRRQVIIFTHDLSFLYHVKQHAEQLSVNIVTHWIREEDGHPGFVYLDNSPVCEKDYKSAEIARRRYSEAKVLPPAEQQMKLQQGFGALRTSYEALIMFDMFKSVVARFEERLSFGRLKDVRIDQGIVDEVIKRMEVLSGYIDAHSHSDALATVKPTPPMLFEEISAFEKIRKRQQELHK